MVTVRKVVLLALDLASTFLTLMTGLRENPVLVLLTGRYDLIRSRFEQQRINYRIIRDDHLNVTVLPDGKDIADSYRFFSAPTRSPENLGTDRSTCRRVNSISAPILTLNYDDFFGKGARREQIYLYSISAPHCEVVNFETQWYAECVTRTFDGNASACHEYILDNFDALRSNRIVQVGVPIDFGAVGEPFLKCRGRPAERFQYMTDLIVLQSYWAGGSYHVEVQSSRCWAMPVLREPDWKWGLFRVDPVDQSADVVFAVKPSSWFANLVAVCYGITSIVMILRGIFIAFSMNNVVVYVPSVLRRRMFGFQLPSMGVASQVLPSKAQVHMLICRGENLMASDLWMNHWLYIALSILDALVSVRTTYIVLEMGTWMLSNERNVENFIFVCAALTKFTWIMCFVHTVFRYAVKMAVQVLHTVTWLHNSKVCSFAVWYVDSVALFMSYKIYSVVLCLALLTIYGLRGTTTIMGRQAHYKQPVYGGYPDVANFWANEIICDLFVLCSIQIVVAHVLVSLVLLTRYRSATYNRMLRIMQDRYVFVGWDALVAMEALGIDPLDSALVLENEVATTNCSFGALIQQLYASGPSGLVEFVGDCVFHASEEGAGVPASLTSQQPSRFARYPLEIAQSMGLFKPVRLNSSTPIELWHFAETHSIKRLNDETELKDVGDNPVHLRRPTLTLRKATVGRLSMLTAVKASPNAEQEPSAPRRPSQCSNTSIAFSDRQFHVHAEWRWGPLLLVDFVSAPGCLSKNAEGTLIEFIVQDAFAFLSKSDVRPLLSQTRAASHFLVPATSES